MHFVTGWLEINRFSRTSKKISLHLIFNLLAMIIHEDYIGADR